jgi:predicted DNA-binding transcriptional regulator AlpA
LLVMEGYLTSDELADRLGIKRGSIYRYRVRGDLPPPDELVGRTPLWRKETIEKWLTERPGQGWRKGTGKN